MYEVYPTSWPALGRPETTREAIDRLAILEARMATDYRGSGTESARENGLVARIRSTLAGRTRQVEPCGCPA